MAFTQSKYSSEAKEATHPQGELLTEFATRHDLMLAPKFAFGQSKPYLPQVFRKTPFRINEPFNSEGDPLAIVILKNIFDEAAFDKSQHINLLEKLMKKDSGYNHHLSDRNGATLLMQFLYLLPNSKFQKEREEMYADIKKGATKNLYYPLTSVMNILIPFIAEEDLTLKSNFQFYCGNYQVTLFEILFYSFGSGSPTIRDNEILDPLQVLNYGFRSNVFTDILLRILERMLTQLEENPSLKVRDFYGQLFKNATILEDALTELKMRKQGVKEERIKEIREERYHKKHQPLKEIKEPDSSAIIQKSLERAPLTSTLFKTKFTDEEIYLSQCAPYTKAYIETFKDKISPSDIVKEMNLTKDELAQLDNCYDKIVTNKMIDRPVMLFEKIYDFSTVMAFNGVVPFRNIPFIPRDIQAWNPAITTFKNIIKKINDDRMANATKMAQAIDDPSRDRPSLR